jgi:hypothetical protein
LIPNGAPMERCACLQSLLQHVSPQ